MAEPEQDDGVIEQLRGEVALGGRVLHASGLSELVWGHVSARDPHGRGVWMKASGLGFEEVTAERVLLIDDDGAVLVGEGPRHSEYPIHTEILRARPELTSVVHVHPAHAIAMAAAGVDLQAFSHAGGVFSAGVRRYDGAPGLVDTATSGAELARSLAGDRALLLTGHGIVTVGSSVATAVVSAIMLERACRLQLLAEGFGGVSAPRTPEQAAVDYAHTLSDQHLLQAWGYLVRSVQAQPPRT